MKNFSQFLNRKLIVAILAFVLVTCLITAIVRLRVDPERVSPDFIQFWTAAKLLSSGQDPYDASLQAEIQRGLGWDRSDHGLGVYDFLPYFYPPWIGLACIPLLPLGYPLAKLTWFVLNLEFLLLAAYLIAGTVQGIPRRIAVICVVGFGPSLLTTAMGQVSPLILLLIASAWALLERGRQDLAAGSLLAIATTKPQLTGILILGLLCRSAMTRRWDVLRGFSVTFVGLCAICFLASPGWPLAMVRATRITPLPDLPFPGCGCSWLITLKALGLHNPLLMCGYLAMAIPLGIAVLRFALDRERGWDELICLSLIASFFIVPYVRYYDVPILLIPVLVVAGSHSAELVGAALMAAVMFVPYLQYFSLFSRYPRIQLIGYEYTYFWIPALIGFGWFYSTSRKMRRMTDLDCQKRAHAGAMSPQRVGQAKTISPSR